MNLPKHRIARALVRRGMLSEKDVPKFLYALNRDKEVQTRFLKVWREGRGSRWTRIRDLAMWFWERREVIMQIISIALLFAEEAPEEKKPAPSRKPEEKSLVKPGNKAAVQPPKPKSEKEMREEALDKLTEESESLGFYDLGANSDGQDDVSEATED